MAAYEISRAVEGTMSCQLTRPTPAAEEKDEKGRWRLGGVRHRGCLPGPCQPTRPTPAVERRERCRVWEKTKSNPFVDGALSTHTACGGKTEPGARGGSQRTKGPWPASSSAVACHRANREPARHVTGKRRFFGAEEKRAQAPVRHAMGNGRFPRRR